MTTISTTTLDCGATLIVEPLHNVASAALTWLLPLGSAGDPADSDGCAAVLSELIFRGAGPRSSREHSDALDRLGAQRSSSVGAYHLHLGVTTLGKSLLDTLPLITDMVRTPQLPDDALEPVRSLCLQSLESLDDDPHHLVMLRLRQKHQQAPFNRHGYGRREALESLTIDALRQQWNGRSVPRGAIIAVAGDVEPAALADTLNQLLHGWTGRTDEPVPIDPRAGGYTHDSHDTAQTHLALAYDAPPESHEHSMLQRVATNVLGGSTSGRLFTEVRQKRSLCYSVGASYSAGRDTGHVGIYAGTTPQRAQETLDVTVAEVRRMKQGIQPDEFKRAVTGLKSHLIMQGESTAARAGALAGDQFRVGRPRSLAEIADAVDVVSLENLNDYLASRDEDELTIVSLGPDSLNPTQEPDLSEEKVQV